MFRADDQIINQRFGNGLVDQRVYTARGSIASESNAINNGKFSTSGAIDVASAIVGIGAGSLAGRFIQNENIVNTVDFSAGLSDFIDSVNNIIQPGVDNPNSSTSGSTCSQ